MPPTRLATVGAEQHLVALEAAPPRGRRGEAAADRGIEVRDVADERRARGHPEPRAGRRAVGTAQIEALGRSAVDHAGPRRGVEQSGSSSGS
jgi:hypothetical protein